MEDYRSLNLKEFTRGRLDYRECSALAGVE
jgi:hypothetical protein